MEMSSVVILVVLEHLQSTLFLNDNRKLDRAECVFNNQLCLSFQLSPKEKTVKASPREHTRTSENNYAKLTV